MFVDPNGKQAWAWGIWGWIGTDLAVPEPTDIVPHKWLGYAIGGAIAGIAIGINYMSKSSSQPKIDSSKVTKEKKQVSGNANVQNLIQSRMLVRKREIVERMILTGTMEEPKLRLKSK